MKKKNQAALLKEFRQRRKMTQKELAEYVGVDAQFISNIERGLAGISPKVARFMRSYGVGKKLLAKTYCADKYEEYMQSL